MHLKRVAGTRRQTRRRHRALVAQAGLVLFLAVVGVSTASGVTGGRSGNETATYIVMGDAPALATYRGGLPGLAATAPAATKALRLDVNSRASRAYRAYLDRIQRRLVDRVEQKLGRSADVRFRYDAVLNAVALELTPNEAKIVAGLPGVKRVVRDELRQLLTDNGPPWIGAAAAWSGSGTTNGVGTKGEGVVVGVIDTGINTDHPSFADIGPVDGHDHTNPRGRFFGNCAPVTGLPFCNDKLIGVYDFTTAPPFTGEDSNGHGSHTASTAAGNVLDARLAAPTYTLDRRISGVAPHANIIAYRACQDITPMAGLGGCLLSALLAAINQATLDEVDVINYSIGGGSFSPWADPDALAFLNARRAGIFVSASAGNDGPGASTVGSPADAPWLLSVGASTHDRKVVNALVGMSGGGSAAPADIEGKSLTSGYGPARIVYAGDYGFPLCGSGAAAADGSAAVNPFTPGTFSGEIVVCDRGTYGRVEKSSNVMEGGAGGFVLANDVANGDSLVGDAYPLPGVHISYQRGVTLKTWLAAGTGHTASIRGTVLDIRPDNGDSMASFSSRGPNPATGDLVKPDVTAPGVDILAAFNDAAGPAPQYGIISGTSMSSPHAAGAAALVRALHPTWTPDEVRAALMTTAFTKLPGTGTEVHGVLKEDAATPADAFDMGAGRIDLRLAGKAGLVLDETPNNYVGANPLTGGDPKTLNVPSMADDECDGGCSWRRVVKSTASVPVTWSASGSSNTGVLLTVAPRTFTLNPGASRTIIVTADVSDAAVGKWHFGQVNLVPSVGSIPKAHLPVAVFSVGEVPDSRLVLHFHGNATATGADHDSGLPREGDCTGDGKTDLIACRGPMLLESPNLSPSPAASWKGGPPEWAFDGASDRTIHDPNWVWCLSVHPQCPTTEAPARGTTTLEGEMTVEWWTECLALCLGGSGDWFIRLYADGVLVNEWRVPLGPSLPGVAEKLRTTVDVPRTTANQRFTLHVEPVFLVDQAVQFGIFYDSTEACPTVSAGPCDSVVRMPVVGDGTTNRSPDAVDDVATVERGESTSVAVLVNDSDPDNDTLSISGVGSPQHGTAADAGDGTITYTSTGGTAASDSFTYTISDGRGGTDTATVDVTITDDPTPGLDGKAVGGGWLDDAAGEKVNFGFRANQSGSDLSGELRLNDRGADVKIYLQDVTSFGAVQSGCGSMAAGPNAVEFRGTGTYNGAAGASFRVCVQDNGEGAGALTGDRFYLTCTSGCGSGYTTSGDDTLDGGNVQVRQVVQTAAQPASSSTNQAASSESQAATLILDPLLLSEGVAGQAQLFTVTAYDQNLELLENATVTLTRTGSNGVVDTFTAVTGVGGTVVFTTVNLGASAEYIATAGSAQSNAIALTPLGG